MPGVSSGTYFSAYLHRLACTVPRPLQPMLLVYCSSGGSGVALDRGMHAKGGR